MDQLQSLEELTELLDGGHTLALLFSRPSCGACRTVKPRLAPLLRRFTAREVDLDTFPKLGRRYQVNSLPTLVVLNREDVLLYSPGCVDAAAVDREIRRIGV
jgi:hypothetical protein